MGSCISTPSSGKRIVYTYLDIYGDGEVFRMMMNKSKADFEDKRISNKDWSEMKKTNPNLKLPTITLSDGRVIDQTHSINRLMARHYGYYPNDL